MGQYRLLSEIKDMITPGTTISWSEMLMQREQVGLLLICSSLKKNPWEMKIQVKKYDFLVEYGYNG